jgi:hypothetical protein
LQPLVEVECTSVDGQNLVVAAAARGISESQAMMAMTAIVGVWYLLLGSFVWMMTEGWELDESIYFCIVSLTTVGSLPFLNNNTEWLKPVVGRYRNYL